MKILVLILVFMPCLSFAGYREECIFSTDNQPQFKTSIDVLGPAIYGNILTIYSYDGGTNLLFLGQPSQPAPGEQFHFELVPNPRFRAFALIEMPPAARAQMATLYLPSSVYGAQMTGTCRFVNP